MVMVNTGASVSSLWRYSGREAADGPAYVPVRLDAVPGVAMTRAEEGAVARLAFLLDRLAAALPDMAVLEADARRHPRPWSLVRQSWLANFSTVYSFLLGPRHSREVRRPGLTVAWTPPDSAARRRLAAVKDAADAQRRRVRRTRIGADRDAPDDGLPVEYAGAYGTATESFALILTDYLDVFQALVRQLDHRSDLAQALFGAYYNARVKTNWYLGRPPPPRSWA